jgi:GH25 family lysozyme M1 (1,4-beta-N-acetylmuramidase)
MTLFGWDASHFDRERFGRPLDMAAARAAGVAYFTHKASEGRSYRDRYLGESLTAARNAGITILGAYVVPRTAGTVAEQGTNFLAALDAAVPWWQSHPLFVLQVDTEIWSRDGVVYDAVSPAKGEQLCQWLRDHTDKFVIHYAPRWAYHDSIPGSTPLWSSSYGTNPAAAPAAVYPGDAGSGWLRYSGRTPLLWQFGSKTIIGPHHTCDANAYRGTLAQLSAIINPTLQEAPMTTTPVDLTYDPRTKPAPVGNRSAATLIADLWGQEVNGGSPVDGAQSARTKALNELRAAVIEIRDRDDVDLDDLADRIVAKLTPNLAELASVIVGLLWAKAVLAGAAAPVADTGGTP